MSKTYPLMKYTTSELVLKFRRDVQFLRFLKRKDELMSVEIGNEVGSPRFDIPQKIKDGESFKLPGGLCRADDVEIIYHGPCDDAYEAAMAPTKTEAYYRQFLADGP